MNKQIPRKLLELKPCDDTVSRFAVCYFLPTSGWCFDFGIGANIKDWGYKLVAVHELPTPVGRDRVKVSVKCPSCGHWHRKPERPQIGTTVSHAKKGLGQITSYHQCDSLSCLVTYFNSKMGEWCEPLSDLKIIVTPK